MKRSKPMSEQDWNRLLAWEKQAKKENRIVSYNRKVDCRTGRGLKIQDKENVS